MYPFALTVGLSPAQQAALVEGLRALDGHPAVAHLYVADEPGAVRSVLFVRADTAADAEIRVHQLLEALQQSLPTQLELQVTPIVNIQSPDEGETPDPGR